jgi:hypothetical protein
MVSDAWALDFLLKEISKPYMKPHYLFVFLPMSRLSKILQISFLNRGIFLEKSVSHPLPSSGGGWGRENMKAGG